MRVCQNKRLSILWARITRINTVFSGCKHLFVREIRVIRA